MNKGGRKVQTGAEVLETERSKSAAAGRGNGPYKMTSGERKAGRLRALIDCTLPEFLEATNDDGHISLSDTAEVRRRIAIYLRACGEAETLPSLLGLAHSMGYSDRALREWIKNRSDTPTGRLLERFSEACRDLLSQSALENNVNPVYAIFLGKAVYGMREQTEVLVTPKPFEAEPTYDPDEIRKRYMLDDGGDEIRRQYLLDEGAANT